MLGISWKEERENGDFLTRRSNSWNLFASNHSKPTQIETSRENSAVQNLITKQSYSALNQYWINAAHYLKISEQRCFSAVQLWKPFFPEQKNQLWTAGFHWINASLEKTSCETHIFGTGQHWLSLKESWSELNSFDSRLLNSGQKELFGLVFGEDGKWKLKFDRKIVKQKFLKYSNSFN